MKEYIYKASNKQQQVTQGTLRASSTDEARSILSSQQLEVLSIKEHKSKGKGLSLGFGGVPLIDKANLFRYLATMLGAGLSLPEAVEVFASDTNNARLRTILNESGMSLQQGKTLSESFKKYPKVFSSIIVALIHAGEMSGTLHESLDYLSDFLYADYKMRQKVKGAMMYPIIIIIAMIGVMFLMLFFVLPRMAPIFLQMRVSLPFYTKIILQGGLFINQYALIIIPLTVMVMVAIVIGLLQPRGKKFALRVVSLLPAIQKLLDYLDLSRFCRILSTLLASGVAINEAMEITSNALAQEKYRDYVGTFKDEMQKGNSLAQLMREQTKLFPQITVRMVAAGERTGQVEELLKESADYYDNEIDDILANFSSIIEPVLLLGIGIAVGFMVVGIIGPIYSLMGGLQGQTGL